MKFIASSSGRLVELTQQQQSAAARRVCTGISGLDELFGGGLVRGAVHELLHHNRSAKPMFPAMVLARAAIGLSESEIRNSRFEIRNSPLSLVPDLTDLPISNLKSQIKNSGVIVISDPNRTLYPPAAAQLGIPLSHLYLLHPSNREQELWAIGECLASAGVAVVVAQLGSLTQVEARRLQLSAERGLSIGVFLRPAGKISSIYAAATRTLVTPATTASGGSSQAWTLELLHGHGCPVGTSVLLEYNREEHALHTSARLADHESAAKTKAIRASA